MTIEEKKSFSKDKMPILKAVMAFVIILGHLSYKAYSVWILPFRYLGAPFVSMFLFISGYGMWQSFLSNHGLPFSSTLKRIWKIVLPYLFTVLLYYLIVRLPSGEFNIDVLEAIMTGTSKQSHLWFVFAIIYLYLTFFFCTRLHRRCTIILSLFAITALTIVLLRKVGYDRCWWVSLLAFPTGCLYSMYKDTTDAINFV